MASIYKDEKGYRFIKSFGSSGTLLKFADERIVVKAHINKIVSYPGISRAGSSVDKIQMEEKIFEKGDYIPPYYWRFAKNNKTYTVDVAKFMEDFTGRPNSAEAEKFARETHEKMRKG